MGSSVVRPAGQGEAYWVLGGLYEVLVSSEETGGTSTIMQMTVPEGAGPPPHTHSGSESVYVLEGKVTFHIDGKAHEAGPGSALHFPAGTLETFAPNETAKLLFIYEPGGIERFFAEVGEAAPRREIPPPLDTPPDLERIARIAEQYGLQMQLPPQ